MTYVVAEMHGFTVIILPSYSDMKVYSALEYTRVLWRGSLWGRIMVRRVEGPTEGALVTREAGAAVVALTAKAREDAADEGIIVAPGVRASVTMLG